MTKIKIYSVVKSNDDEFEKISNNFIKMSSKYGKVEYFNLFNNKIAKAQNTGELEAKKAYSEAYEPFLNSYNIALDVKGDRLDSFAFADLIKNKTNINFFIGGAYGFEENFLKKCNKIISLSDLTMAHKVAILVLNEQIFRAFCINNNHPYHK